MGDPIAPDAVATLYAALVSRLVALGLVSLRLAPLALVTPLLGGRALPAQARAVLFAALALGLFPATQAAPSVPASFGPWLALAALREVVVGAAFALVVSVPFFALEHAGRLLDVARGANAAEVTAPDSGARSSPLAELLRWTFTVAFVSAGGLRAVLRAFSATLELAPPMLAPPSTTALTLRTGELAERAMRASSDTLASGFTLASAGLVSLFAVEAALALASRLAPALAHAQLALPLRALLPLGAVALASSAWTGAALDLARAAISVASALAP